MQTILIAALGLILLFSTLTTIPIIVAVLLCYTVISRKPRVFLIALILGLLIDLFSLRILGTTALFLVIFAALILLYQRRFEIQTITFVFLSSFLGSIFYLEIFLHNFEVFQALICATFAVIIFKILQNPKISKFL